MKLLDKVKCPDGHVGKIGEFDIVDGKRWVKVNLENVISLENIRGLPKKWYLETELKLV